MPESVADRCTKSHEYVFLLSKSARYHYDHEAIKEPAGDWKGDFEADYKRSQYRNNKPRKSKKRGEFNGKTNALKGREAFRAVTETRNKRDVWTVATRPYKGAHFAVFPEKLIEPCVLAGCPKGGNVLDPFTGSGTTGIVALEHGCNFIGSEINPDYFEIARERLEHAASQRRLFA
jgi:DNA modification methylase